MISHEALMRAKCVIEEANFRCGLSLGVAYEDGYVRYELGDQGIFPAASTIKLAILGELLRRFSIGDLNPSDRVTIKSEDMVDGGVLCELEAGHMFTLRELARLMMIVSDNIASNILLNIVSMDNVNESLRRWHLFDTVIRRKFMESPALRGENTTTPKDMVELLRAFDSGEIVPEPWRDEGLAMMHRQMFRERIPHRLPANVWCGNKVGDLEGVQNDIAIIAAGDKRLYMAIFTEGVPEIWRGDDTIASLAKICYEGFFQ